MIKRRSRQCSTNYVTIFFLGKFDICRIIKAEVLYHSCKDGGLQLPHIISKTTTAKLLDLRTSFSIQPEMNQSLPCDIKKLMKWYNHNINFQSDCLSISNGTSHFVIKRQTCFSDLYAYLVSTAFPKTVIDDRLQSSCSKYNCTTQTLKLFIRQIWSRSTLFPHERNALYRLAYNTIRDKQRKWLDNLAEHPLCNFCSDAFETVEHLLFHCPSLEKTRSIINFRSWTDVFVNPTESGLRLCTSVLLGSMRETPENTLEYLDAFLQLN